MFNVGATSPKTAAQRLVWWAAFFAFAAFITYVIFHNL